MYRYCIKTSSLETVHKLLLRVKFTQINAKKTHKRTNEHKKYDIYRFISTK